MSMTYGFSIRATGDPWVRMVEQAFTIVAGAAVAGKYLVDVFPILRYIPDWMPGAQFKRDARKWKATLKDSVFTPFEAARQALVRFLLLLGNQSVERPLAARRNCEALVCVDLARKM